MSGDEILPAAETTAPPDAPWLSAPEWRDNRIRSSARGALFAVWFAALVGLAVSVPILVFVPEEIAGGNAWAALAFVFPAVTLPFAIAAIRRTVEWRRYGRLALVMDPFPGSLGGDVGGSVVLPVGYRSSHRYEVRLACSRVYESGSGDDRTTHVEAIWARDGVAEAAATPGGTRVSFRFAVPGHLPASEPRSDDYRFWSMRMRERGGGLDRTFEVPVFATGGARSEARIGESHEALVDVAAPRLPPRVVRMRQDGLGVELVFPPLRNAPAVLLSLVPASIFLAVGVGILAWVMLSGGGLFESGFTLVPLIVGGAFALIGLVALVAALAGLGHGMTVRATSDEVVVRHRVFGIPTRTRRMAASAIVALDEEVGLRAGSRGGSTRYRCLVALDSTGAKLALAEGIRDPAVLRHLRDAISAATRFGGRV